jgi:uncharacterized protein (DUF305 family)
MRWMGALLIVAAPAVWGCRTHGEVAAPIVQPGAPGQPSREVTASQAADVTRVQHTAADVRFMQGMIHHHAQALEMTALVRTRTRSDAMRTLALRIEVSQLDEIAMMRHWLEARGQQVPVVGDGHAGHGSGSSTGGGTAGALMPGMLTAEEMARLAGTSGDEFDRLFLAGMIKHHGGALAMVQALFSTPGAGQESEMYAFASDVDADQRMEIDRMSGMLKELDR